MLIQRLLKLLAAGEIASPADILAITFTRKAAQELRTRVLDQLLLAANQQPLAANAGEFEQITRGLAAAVLERDRLMGWHLLESPQQLNIRTIDSFCGELARNMPLLSGGIGRRRPMEDASSLYEEAAGRVLRELGGRDAALDGALRCLLLHRDGRVEDVITLIAGMLAGREQWGALMPLTAVGLTDDRLDGEVRSHLERTLAAVLSLGLEDARQSLPSGWLDELAEFAARMSALPGYNGGLSPLLPCTARPAAPGNTPADHDHWLALIHLVLTAEGNLRSSLHRNVLKFELPQAAKPQLQELIERLRTVSEAGSRAREALCAVRALPPASLPDDQWEVLKAVFRILRRALAELEVLFAERGVCDFTALALAARRLLDPDQDPDSTQDPDKSLHSPLPGMRLQHLLVDEMQDTSVGQYRLFELLTRFWDGGSQTVFLVGDPKQSIYAFRQARVERFLRTQRTGRLGEVPLGTLHLTANFRSQAELVQDFNRTFAHILPRPEELSTQNRTGATLQEVEVPYIAAVPVRSPGALPALHWHTRIASPSSADELAVNYGDDLSSSVAEQDACSIRLSIEHFLQKWSAAGRSTDTSSHPRIAVLARNRAHLAPILKEFQRSRGGGPLPFRAVEIEVLDERPEVLDLLAITRALLHPGDRVAWLAVLRSPVCGLGLADLLTLTGEGEGADTSATVAHLVTTRQHLLSPIGQRLLTKVWPVLAQAQATLGRTSLATHVERTWRSLGADASLGPDSLANARRFLLLLHQLENGAEPLNLRGLERRVRKLYAESADPHAVVELMTIHKSKGLEWDLVLIPALERGSGRGNQELLRWFELDEMPGDRAPVVLAPLGGKGEEASKLWRWLAKLQTQRELAEAKRLFYVACTRAREELHLYGTAELTKSGQLAQPQPSSLLRAAWASAQPIFAQALVERQQPGAATTAPSPILLPAAFPQPAPHAYPLALAAAAALPAPPTLPRIERLPRSFDSLARFRPEAGPGLRYPPASSLRHAAPFARPKGSFAARAFGNVVHRFLDLLARKLAQGSSTRALAAELPHWSARLHGAFRAEGLPPALCERDAKRALRALEATLLDPVGHWLLSPHEAAWSERALQVHPAEQALPATLRADRVFLGGAHPLANAASTHLWIVDFKTADQGSRPDAGFQAAEREKYSAQMSGYARACLALGDSRPIVLALFYPLLPHLVYWPFSPQQASE